ncbi:hypothetical protein D3C76_1043490 [compost metagenome]
MLDSLENASIPVEKIGGKEAGLIAGGAQPWAYCPYHYASPYYRTIARQVFAKMVQYVSKSEHKWAFCPYYYHGTYYRTVAKQLLARVIN